MSAAWTTLAALAAVAATALGAAPVAAQTLAQRVAAARADVRMTYPARDGVCGSEHGWIGTRGDRDWQGECASGPVRLQIDKDGQRIVAVRAHVGGSWQPRSDVTDLGEVRAVDAADFLLDLAASAAPAVAEDAIMPAVIADAPDPWQRLLTLARNRSLTADVREQAVFWLGQSAAREATAGLTALVEGDDSVEVQKAAVFALSQRDDPERIERLIGVAQTHANREVVNAAFFWLADSEDPRAVDFFEKVLTD